MIPSVHFIPNTPDNKRCTQAAFRMVYEALTGTDPGCEEADRLTGYVEGRGTWQFRSMLALAEAGLEVTDCELFDPDEFLADPAKAIARQVGDPVVAQKNIDDTDLKSEVDALAACLAHPRIKFDLRIPIVDDLQRELEHGRLAMCNVNNDALRERPGHTGHMIVVYAVTADGIRFHNPGPPPQEGQLVGRDLFERAWMNPIPEMANYIAAGPRIEAARH